MKLTKETQINVVKIENSINIIEEKRYQQFKKELCKNNDYFSMKEYDELIKKLTLF